jgi:hypothetical protein
MTMAVCYVHHYNYGDRQGSLMAFLRDHVAFLVYTHGRLIIAKRKDSTPLLLYHHLYHPDGFASFRFLIPLYYYAFKRLLMKRNDDSMSLCDSKIHWFHIFGSARDLRLAGFITSSRSCTSVLGFSSRYGSDGVHLCGPSPSLQAQWVAYALSPKNVVVVCTIQ